MSEQPTQQELDEARLWARAYRTLDVHRLWRYGAWGIDPDNPPAWLLEPLPGMEPEEP